MVVPSAAEPVTSVPRTEVPYSSQGISVDVAASVEEYLDQTDWRVRANANQGYSLGGLILNTAGKVLANYWLSHVYPREIGEAHRCGDLHIHDLDMLSGYCAGWSLRMLLQAGTPEKPYYTNSSQLPVGFTDDPFEALERQEELQRRYTGGTVLHLYMSERISSARACRELVRRALENFAVPYITVTPTFSICPVHGYLDGEHPYCPLCDDEILARKNVQPLNPRFEEDLLLLRRGLLESVVFSGGEPTLQEGLHDAIGHARRLGFRVGLHTAAIFPRRLATLLDDIDWLGLDVKAPFDRYSAITGSPAGSHRVAESLDLVLEAASSGRLDYEVPTTFHLQLLDEKRPHSPGRRSRHPGSPALCASALPSPRLCRRRAPSRWARRARRGDAAAP